MGMTKETREFKERFGDFREDEKSFAMEKTALSIMEICHEFTECEIEGGGMDAYAYPFYEDKPPNRYNKEGKLVPTGEHSPKDNCKTKVAEEILALIKRFAEIDKQ